MGLRSALIIGLLLAITAAANPGSSAEAAPRADASEMAAFFHDDLAPYGKWIDHRIYGVVWVPDSGRPDWHPYTDGRWIWTTDYGWYWDSREPYGWATYHYGRWAMTSDYGWVWVPGAEWGPAWVDWRYGGGHVGWAPMPPEWGPQHDSYRTPKSEPEARAWIFVSVSSFVEADVGGHRAPAAVNAKLLATSTRVTNYASVDGRIVNRSIDAGEVATAAGIKISPARVGSARTLAEQAALGAQGSIAIYRPVVLSKSQLGAGLPAALDLNLPADNRPADLDSEALAKAQQKLDAKALPDQSSSSGSFETGAGGTIGGDPVQRAPSSASSGGLGVGVPGVGGLRVGR